MLTRTHLMAVALVFGLGVAGCGSDDDGGSNNGTGGASSGTGGASSGTGGSSSTGNGVTPCGNFPDSQPKSCQAGQYCADEIISDCQNGCLSNTNCASDQTCEKSAGEDVGTCQAVQGSTECAPVCAKLQACDPSITQAMCDQFCAGTNEACKTCVVNANCTNPDACANDCDF